tara:strand:- start:11888 stop:12184 length:297 start_codon:yes stop_codon:yes gene_type:complete
MYKPLPSFITIKESPISGLGLFATEPIKANTYIGTILIELDNEIIRTPIGGFGNHSDTPNCEKRKYIDRWNLVTKRDIQRDEELTWTYTLYEINDGNA